MGANTTQALAHRRGAQFDDDRDLFARTTLYRCQPDDRSIEGVHGKDTVDFEIMSVVVAWWEVRGDQVGLLGPTCSPSPAGANLVHDRGPQKRPWVIEPADRSSRERGRQRFLDQVFGLHIVVADHGGKATQRRVELSKELFLLVGCLGVHANTDAKGPTIVTTTLLTHIGGDDFAVLEGLIDGDLSRDRQRDLFGNRVPTPCVAV